MNSIGEKLRELREKNNLTRKEAVEKLKELGFDISDKTLYGYESGRNSANADMFLSLCKIYGCQNIMETFSDSVDDILFTNDEWNMIEEYRVLDAHGKEIIDFVLKKELERMEHLQAADSAPAAEPVSFPEHQVVNAAHADENSTAEERQADDDMMMDDSEWE